MDIATAIVTIVISSPLWVFATHLINRRSRHAEARLKNAEADQKELAKKKDEVDYYRSTIKDLVSDMEALRLAQGKAEERYQENTDGLHRKIDRLTEELEKANGALGESKQEIGELRQEVKDGNVIITELREKISQLLVEREKKK